MPFCRVPGTAWFCSLLIAVALGCTAAARTPDNPAAAPKPGQNSPADASKYVGADTCKTCHEDIFKDFEKTPHFATTLDTKRGPEWHGCEACHGPGKEHVESGGDKTKIFTFKGATARDASQRCLACHSFADEHSNFERSAHLQNNVGCIQCHSPHHAQESEHLLREKAPQLCYGCHLEVKQQFQRPFHHRVNEGLVQCSDCHNPHGGFLSRQLRATSSQDTVCFKCHSEKAGPFVYEHPPVKVEGCVSCHMPHGSANPRLLKRSQVNLLCLECHSLTLESGAPNTPEFHNQAQKYQACTMCHVAIHGSNFDHVFFK